MVLSPFRYTCVTRPKQSPPTFEPERTGDQVNGQVYVKVASPEATRMWQVHVDKYFRPIGVEPAIIDAHDAHDAITIEIPRVVPVASEVLTAVRRYFGYSYRLSA